MRPLHLVTALLLPLLLLGPGCMPASSEEEGRLATVSFSIAVEEQGSQSLPLPGPRLSLALPPGPSALGYSAADVTFLRIDVREQATNNPIYLNFDLVKAAGGWTGNLPSLPKGKLLTFTARASSANDVPLFTGSTLQALYNDVERVSISLSPVNDWATISLPRVRSIIIPSEFIFGQSGNISFLVEGSANETLSYTLTPAEGGGSFLPATGSSTLAGTLGMFVVRYIPSVTVAAPTTFTHQFKVTNAAGHSISTTFTTRVLPLTTSGDAPGTNFSVLFNPVINALDGSRVAGTSQVVWTASVADDGPLSALSYRWSFTPTGSVSPVPAFTTQSNPTTLQNYTPSLQGLLKLEVSDGNGGTTTLSYVLAANQFPDNPIELGPLSSIQTGGNHTCALFNEGSVRCWGANGSGQLGYGHINSIGDNELPFTAGRVPLSEAVVQVATGGSHTCTLSSSGSVRCWGYNGNGHLGYGHTLSIGDDEAVTSQGYLNLGGRVQRIVAGSSHTCALLASGRVRCWGYNGNGQLGYAHTQSLGDNEGVHTLVDIQLGGTAVDLAAGESHTCALMSSGRVRCWGLNNYGQLGYGHVSTIGDNEHPATAGDVNVGGTVVQLSAGSNSSCALLDTGSVRCWGLNNYGQLGYGHVSTIGDNEHPATAGDVNMAGPAGSKVLQVAAATNHTCALLSTGSLKCWGYNGYGQLGHGNTTNTLAPTSTTAGLGGLTAYTLTAAGNSTCALLGTGKARCWGNNGNGQLGYGHTAPIGDNELPDAAGDIALTSP